MADSFLSQAEIETTIGKFSRSREGGSAIKNAMGNRNAKADQEKMIRKADEMKEILFRHITADTQTDGRRGLADFPKSAIIVGRPVAVGNTGNYRIDISFDTEALRRHSLDPDAYPDGITDIISLFVHGYKANGPVVGSWHGADNVWNLRHRDANDFMSQAVDEFNNIGEGFARAVLVNKYE